ncbi:unnamed protein product, partial [Prorocentrum cordatum]
CALELPARRGGGELQFDRVYHGGVPTEAVCADALLPLVQLALAGGCCSAVVLAACAVGRRGPAHGARASGGEVERELGLAVALALLAVRALWSARAEASPAASSVLLSWCALGRGRPPVDLLRGRAPSAASAALPGEPAPRLREDLVGAALGHGVLVDGLVEVELRTMDEHNLLSVLRAGAEAAESGEDAEHGLLSLAVGRGESQARGLLRIFSLRCAGEGAGNSPLQPALEALQLPRPPTAPAGAPPLERLLAGCFRPLHRTLLVACVPQGWDADEAAVQALRLGAQLRLCARRLASSLGPSAASARSEAACSPEGAAVHARASSSGHSSSWARRRVRAEDWQRERRPTASTSEGLHPEGASRQGAVERYAFFDPRWTSRRYGANVAAASSRVRAGSAGGLAAGRLAASPSRARLLAAEGGLLHAEAALERRVRLQEVELEAERTRTAQLQESCEEHQREAESLRSQCEGLQEARRELREKDRSLLELQVKAGEARRYEERLREEVAAERAHAESARLEAFEARMRDESSCKLAAAERAQREAAEARLCDDVCAKLALAAQSMRAAEDPCCQPLKVEAPTCSDAHRCPPTPEPAPAEEARRAVVPPAPASCPPAAPAEPHLLAWEPRRGAAPCPAKVAPVPALGLGPLAAAGARRPLCEVAACAAPPAVAAPDLQPPPGRRWARGAGGAVGPAAARVAAERGAHAAAAGARASWELAELRGFLEGRFGGLGGAAESLFAGGRQALRVEALAACLRAAGYDEGAGGSELPQLLRSCSGLGGAGGEAGMISADAFLSALGAGADA